MTLSAATVTFGPHGPTLSAAAPLPVEALVLGKPVAVVAELLPRLFNLCRCAQGLAARLSLGLTATEDPVPEVIRDHALRLCVTLPVAFGLPPRPLPADATRLLGPQGRLQVDPDDLLRADPLARLIAETFPAGKACCAILPPATEPLSEGAFENSAAGRQSSHPLVRGIESAWGGVRCGAMPVCWPILRPRWPTACLLPGWLTAAPRFRRRAEPMPCESHRGAALSPASSGARQPTICLPRWRAVAGAGQPSTCRAPSCPAGDCPARSLHPRDGPGDTGCMR